jgi:hypothetical protein
MGRYLTIEVKPGRLQEVLDALEAAGSTVHAMDPAHPLDTWQATVQVRWGLSGVTDDVAQEAFERDCADLAEALRSIPSIGHWAVILEDARGVIAQADPDGPAVEAWRRRAGRP